MLKPFSFLSLWILLALVYPEANYAISLESPKLTLSAEATIRKPADELQLKIGVINLSDTAEMGLIENSVKMQAIIDSLEAAGLTKNDYETGQFSINPTYTPYPKDPPSDWAPSINGYEISNSINIHTDKLHIAGKLIDVANKAGANSISDLRFGLRNPRLYWTEALTAAASNAVNDARAIAFAAGVQLERVLSITLNDTKVKSPQINSTYIAKAMAAEIAPPIEPGEVTITANVTIIYEISSH